MANPNEAVGTNGAFGGRTSVNAFNDALSAFTGRGILSGWNCSPSSGLTVTLGGNGTNRDVAIAEDASGNKTTINNISQAPISVTVNAAPASNSRIDAIVAYVEGTPNGSGITDNPDVVNLLVVSGTVTSSPVAPTDTAIRSAITADGASGATAYYVVLANVTIATGTTDIDSTMISAGGTATLRSSSLLLPSNSVGTSNIIDGAVTANKIGFSSFPKIVTVNFTNGTSTATARALLGQQSVSELNTGWLYLCVINMGLLFALGGSDKIAFADFSIPSPETDIIPNSRIRANGNQTTISFSTFFTPPASAFTINFNGSGNNSGLTWEDVSAYFIPLRPVSN